LVITQILLPGTISTPFDIIGLTPVCLDALAHNPLSLSIPRVMLHLIGTGVTLVVLLLRAEANHPCVKDGVVVASCYGFNATDGTDALQAALSSNASLVIVDR
jgi:hypothetical protein